MLLCADPQKSVPAGEATARLINGSLLRAEEPNKPALRIRLLPVHVHSVHQWELRRHTYAHSLVLVDSAYQWVSGIRLCTNGTPASDT